MNTFLYVVMLMLAGSHGSVVAQTADASAGRFDGVYRGRLTQTSKNCLSGANLPDAQNVRLVVRNGAFPWTINKVRTMVPIGANGEIAARTPYIELRGKATGSVLEWDSINATCFNRWHFDRE